MIDVDRIIMRTLSDPRVSGSLGSLDGDQRDAVADAVRAFVGDVLAAFGSVLSVADRGADVNVTR